MKTERVPLQALWQHNVNQRRRIEIARVEEERKYASERSRDEYKNREERQDDGARAMEHNDRIYIE